MKKLLLAVGLLLMLGWGGGCVVISVGEAHECIRPAAESRNVVICVSSTPDPRT